jgi:hypothetical protein
VLFSTIDVGAEGPTAEAWALYTVGLLLSIVAADLVYRLI